MSLLSLSYDFGASAKPLLGQTLGGQLDTVANQWSMREALVCCEENIRFTYRQLTAQIDLFARGLLSLGIQTGDRIGIWSTNNSQWVITQFASAKIGAILVNINPAYRSSELEYALRQSGVKLIVLMPGYKGDEFLAMLHELAPELRHPDMDNPSPRLPELKKAVVIGQSNLNEESVLSFASVLAKGEQVSCSTLKNLTKSLDFDSPINIQYTSGTTGFPKGVTLSHHNLLNNALYCAQAMGLNETSRFVSPMPFYHCGGMVLGTLATLFSGGTLIIPVRTFEAQNVLSALEKEHGTHLSGVPTMYIAELEHPEFSNFNLSSLEGGFMAGAPCPIDLMQQVQTKMHMTEIVIFYGQTECSPLITSTTSKDSLEIRVKTIGKVIDHMEIKITDPQTGAIVERGVQGEICARGYAVMHGYWGNEQATKQCIDAAGWLHTGDLGIMHEEGHLNITGRKKEMIIRGGENVYPREVEEVLHGHPEISQAHVFGVPDAHLGEEVAVWLQLKAGSNLAPKEIQEWLKERLSYFKVPKYVKVVTDFPMTVTGKVQKFIMREVMINELGLTSLKTVQTA